MLLAMYIIEKDLQTVAQKAAVDKRRFALMLHYAGSEVVDVYHTLPGEEEDKDVYTTVKPLLDTIFSA